MRRLVLILLALVAVGAVVITVQDLRKPTPAERGGKTHQRIDYDRLRIENAEALKRLRAKDMAGAEKAFAAQLAKLEKRHGKDSAQAADRLIVFGYDLSEYGFHAKAAEYHRRAAATYRKAFGAESAEAAEGLAALADTLAKADPDLASPELMATLEESLRIRRKVLGLNNAETAAAYAHLGQARGLAVNTGGDPAKVEAAADLVRTALQILDKAPNAETFDLQDARFHLTEVYARNGRGPEALRASEAWESGKDGYTDGQAHDLADRLEKAGDLAAAESLRERYLLEERTEAQAR